jgi:hypothetical protein
MKVDINEKCWGWSPSGQMKKGKNIILGNWNLEKILYFIQEDRNDFDKITVYFCKRVQYSRKIVTHIFTYKEANRLLKLNQL